MFPPAADGSGHARRTGDGVRSGRGEGIRALRGVPADAAGTARAGPANGCGIALAPESAARFYARPGITYRPVSGVSPSRVGVAWSPVDDGNAVVRDFVDCCRGAVAGRG
ncbi:LysR substrate-binding domain-containing protein [Streptomyces sp. NPDC096153]|uniref:LysR substrate-binding domain-containing protein n=1 Tax=Streptomyces sp. NPDC096153 TaxID=3155548 RepID=UPI003327C9B5